MRHESHGQLAEGGLLPQHFILAGSLLGDLEIRRPDFVSEGEWRTS
jgi:hypothetical protein